MFFIVKDFFGRTLGMRTDGSLCSSSERKVILYINKIFPSYGALVRDDFPNTFSISGFPKRRSVFFLEIIKQNRGVALKRFETNMFLCSLPDESMPIEANRSEVNDWEIFQLEEVSPNLSEENITCLDLLFHTKRKYQNVDFLIYLLKKYDRSILSPVFETMISFLPEKTIGKLTDTMVGDISFSEKICSLLPQDIWNTFAIPASMSFRRKKTLPFTETSCGPELDTLGQVEDIERRNTQNATSTFLINSSLRANAVPQRNSCIIATVRNEGVYLPEWIAYHKALGFDEIYLYSNNNDDGSDLLLDILDRNGVIKHIKNEILSECRPQIKAYCHALSILPDILDFRWCAILDVDEFIGYDTTIFTSFSDYLAWMDIQEIDAIALSWVIFTPSEQRIFQKTGLLKNFTYRQTDTDVHVKTIVRPSEFYASGPHSPNTIRGKRLCYATSSGNTHSHEFASSANYGKNPTDRYAWVAHYHLKSTQDFLWKMNRGTGMDSSDTNFGATIRQDFIPHFVHAFGNNDKINDPRMSRLAGEDFLSQLNEIYKISGVLTAYNNCLRRYLEKTETIREHLKNKRDNGLLNALLERC